MQSSRLWELALKGLEAERDRIETEIVQVRNQINGSWASVGMRCYNARNAQDK